MGLQMCRPMSLNHEQVAWVSSGLVGKVAFLFLRKTDGNWIRAHSHNLSIRGYMITHDVNIRVNEVSL